MQTAVYIEDGHEQIVLTPETEFEKMIVSKLIKRELGCEIKKESFYHCQGGYLRQSSDDSLIIVPIREKDENTNDFIDSHN